MTKTPSNMMPLRTKAPDFDLPDTVSGTSKTLAELKSDTATVIMFICNHCPFVKHIRYGLIHMSNDYIPKGISVIAISANDASEFPEDAPDLYIFDRELTCAYRGQFDSSRPESGIPVTGEDLRSTLENILAGKPISIPQRPSLGCNIKWRQ